MVFTASARRFRCVLARTLTLVLRGGEDLYPMSSGQGRRIAVRHTHMLECSPGDGHRKPLTSTSANRRVDRLLPVPTGW